MNSDPAVNVIVFSIRRQGQEEIIMNEVRTQALDGVEIAWGQAQYSHNAKANEVYEIFSEWETTEEDDRFIDEHFPTADVSYSYERPQDGNWEEAFARVQRDIEDLIERKGHLYAPILLPILCNDDARMQTLVHWPVGMSMVICLAYVKHDEDGGIRFEYITKAKAYDMPDEGKALWNEAFDALIKGLEVSVGDYQGEKMVTLKGRKGFIASMLLLPGFYDNASRWTQSERITVAIPDPDTIILCDANLAVANHLRELVLNSPYQGVVDLTPGLFIYDQNHVWLMERRPNP